MRRTCVNPLFVAVTVIILTTAALSVVIAVDPEGKSGLQEARHLLLTGKFAEAEEAFEKLQERQPIESALGRAKCQQRLESWTRRKRR